MSFHSQDLVEKLRALTAGDRPGRWIVAYSGGMDSTVLLHALATSRNSVPILAVHIDHGLQVASADWAEHCARFAAELGVMFECRKVRVSESGGGLEAAAREARYAAFLDIVHHDDYLLSGHHEDDQAETLLLNLMRGSGPAGLAGIGGRQSFGRGWLLRPLLGVPRADLESYARDNDLRWIEDPSNVDTRFDRNFLREEVLPLLAARWPAVTARLRRSAELVSESSELLNDLADIDLAACGTPDRLSIAALQTLSAARQRNLLRRAVRLLGLPPVPAGRLAEARDSLMGARPDAQPLVTWAGAEMRRYQGRLYLMAVIEPAGTGPSEPLQPGDSPVLLGTGLGALCLAGTDGIGLDPEVARRGLSIRFRHGGEGIRIRPGGPTRKLKKLLQEAGILPWMRDRLPLLFAGEQLVAVGDLWLSADHQATPGFEVRWLDRPAID